MNKNSKTLFRILLSCLCLYWNLSSISAYAYTDLDKVQNSTHAHNITTDDTKITAAVEPFDRSAYSYTASHSSMTQNWMKLLSDQSLLSELSLPGTHDSMALYGGSLGQTQVMPLKIQLQAGVRVLDIRCRHVDNQFAIYHGIISQNANFDDVLTTIRAFLQLAPSETILMRVKEEYDPKNNTRPFWQTFLEYRQRYSDIFWDTTSQNPQLGEIRGRIVLLRDFSLSQIDYPKEAGIVYENLNTQDDYALKSIQDLYSKWTKVKQQLDYAQEGNRATLFINYLSGSPDSSSISFPLPYAYFVASGQVFPQDGQPLRNTFKKTTEPIYPDFPRAGGYVYFEGTNSLVSQYLSDPNIVKKHVGMVMIDFPGQTLLDRIISQNMI